MVSGRTSTKTSVAPAKTKEFAVLENVKLGRITSSPGLIPHNKAAISSAVEPLVVSITFFALKRFSSHSLHFFVNGPSPQILWLLTASCIYLNSVPTNGGTLK